MEGPTIWVDVYKDFGPKYLHGLGIEMEAHDISFNRPPNVPSNFREDTLGGGPIYSWRPIKNLSIFGKLEWEEASIDFHGSFPDYNHETRGLYALGGGLEYRIWRHVSVRGEYEAQFWQTLFQDHTIATPTGFSLRPRGVTLGAVYEFDHLHTRSRVQLH
jgi:opacity protein-like surface antigen